MLREPGFINERLLDFAERQPSAPAIRVGGRKWGYGALAARVNQLVDALRGHGVRPGDRVGLLCNPGFEAIAAMLAALEIGAAYVPMDADLPAGRLAFLVSDSRMAYLLAQPELRDRLPASSGGARLDTIWNSLDIIGFSASARAASAKPIAPRPEELAYIIYTSGSTGAPKGVMASRKGLANYLTWCVNAYGSPDWNEALVGSSLAVDLTITGLFAPLLRGACVAMLPDHDVIGRWVKGLQEVDGSCLIKIAPTQLNLLLPHLTPDLAGKVAALVVGGEPLEWRTVRWWKSLSAHTRVFNEYGPTETVVGCAAYEALSDAQTGWAPIGRPIANTQAYVLGPSLEPLAEGSVGELWIGGDGVAHGYLGRPGLTAARFAPNPYGAPGSRIYRTGDLARRSQDSLEFLGRIDSQVKLRGHRVELSEIESALLGFPGVSAAAVALEKGLASPVAGEGPTPSDGGGRTEIRRFTKPEATEDCLVAYIALRGGVSPPTYVELRQWLGERLPAYMIPKVFVVTPRLPILASGKIDRASLARVIGREIPPATCGGAPRTDMERALCEIVSDALGLAAVGVHDNFFDLGGDSIRAIAVHAKARELGLNVELADFFKYQTIAGLAGARARLPVKTQAEAATRRYALISEEDRSRLPSGVEDAYPLAKLQGGLIFHSQESDHSANYHDVFVYQIRSAFDRRALSEAFARVVRRHPALRTSFALAGYSEPLQLVWETAPAEPHIHDLRGLRPDEQERALIEWIAAEKKRAFDFRRPPLLRLHLLRTADDVAHWALSFHDSILDGWSLATFLVELLTCYSGELAGAPVDEPPLTTTYRDFVEREREALRDESQRNFWVKYLDGRAAAMPDRRETAADRRPRVVEVDLPPELSDALHGVARLLRVPVKHALLAAHVHVTGLMSGQVDVVTGLESHGRIEADDGDRVLGMHLNTLPLRVQLRGGSWSDLIQAVYEAERAIFPFRRYPYASIHKEQGGAGLYSTVFNYTHFHRLREISALPGIEPLGGCGFGQRHYALSAEFNQDPHSNHLRLDLECNVEDSDERYCELVKRAYEKALRDIAADPMGRYDHSGVEDIRGAEAERPTITPDALPTVVDQWLRRVRETPDALAVIDDRREVTYAQLLGEAQSLARRLQAAGFGAEDCVGLYFNPGIEQIAAVWATLLAGAAYVSLDPALPPNRLRQMLADARIEAVISKPDLRDSWERVARDLPQLQLFLADEAGTAPPPDGGQGPAAHPQQLAYITYTSGSTGAPKGVRVSHRNLSYSTAVRQSYYAAPPARFLLIPSLSHDSAVAVVYWTLCAGGTLVIPSYGDARDPDRLVALIERHRVTHWLSVPALYDALLLRASSSAIGSLQCAIVAGEACQAGVAAASLGRRGIDMFNEYGPSEATVWATVHRVGEPASGATVPIGWPIDGARVYLLDSHLRPVAPGVTGEVYIGGYGVSRGYGSASATAERFLPDPFSDQLGERMYRTGDLARRGPDGVIEFIGRADRQVKIRGYRVEPAEIESVMRTIDGVRDVAVVAARTRGDQGMRLVAYVVPAQSPLDVSALRRACAQSLPAPLVPSAFVPLDELPRSENGKVDLRCLAELGLGLYDAAAAERALARVEAMADSEVEALLRDLAAEESRQRAYATQRISDSAG